ncbi:MAG: hypothetical protein QOG83_996 [Alphaproteobacteria bacterium]|jgi:hypothetical protein|nr:hypothetical protein [Alphaproteobacteria bacterium]MEA2988285.1 hypothetical protein [Alphaproteobacteria bacterium]
MSNATPLARIAVGVVVERRKAMNPWVDFVWQPVTVLPGLAQAAPWTVLSADAERTMFYAGAAEIELYRTETAHYRDNLAAVPSLWVALRATGVEPPYDIVAVTADPAEGESFTQVGDDVVEAVPMPAAVREIVEAFVAEHHVERPFVKRKRERADPQALARRGPMQKDPGE